jgi:catalase-peroxidase
LENSFGTGNGINTISSGLEGAWTTTAKWSNDYFDHFIWFRMGITKSLLEHQWKPVNNGGVNSPRCSWSLNIACPFMLTTDLALRMDPKYEPISRKKIPSESKRSLPMLFTCLV